MNTTRNYTFKALLISLLFFSALCHANVFGDAKWIGAPTIDLPVYPDYLSVFKIDFDLYLPSEGKACIIYGANDPRLMNRNMNIFNLENPEDSIGIRISFDADGKIDVFRYGFHPDDTQTKPIASFTTDKLHEGSNHITITSNNGHTDIYAGGEKVGYIGVNPLGNGGDYIAFPILGAMSVVIPEENGAKISNLTVCNLRAPGNALYKIPEEFSSSSAIDMEVRSMPEIKTQFKLPNDKTIAKATLHSTARGIYDLHINGKRVSDDYFNPGYTQYNKTHLYQTFDVLPFLKSGENELNVQLAEGWWCGPSTYIGENWNFFGDRPSFIGNLIIEYSDGTSESICSSPETWKYSADGPLKEGSFFNGEVYDASLKGNASRKWLPAVEISLDSTANHSVGSWNDINFLPSFGNNVCAFDTINAISLSVPRPGVFVYDMGQNMAAVPYIEFGNLDKGQEVTMRFAEVLYPNLPQYSHNVGMVMTENLRAAMCKDIYKASGEGNETFSPRFTFHGYRFLEITGIDKPLPLEAVKSIPISSIHDFKAHFECSDSLVNRLWENIKWSSLSNFISVPTDCPQRNERLGWMGDISMFAPTATKLAEISALLQQFLTSVRDCQDENGRYPDVAPTGIGFGGILWGSAGITVPWEYYCQYGDAELLKTHYPSMKKYVDYILNETMEPETGLIVQNRAWDDLADWLSPEYEKSDKSLLWECYFIHDLEIMKKIAKILGKDADAGYFGKLHEERVKFFADNYVDKATGKTVFSGFDPNRIGTVIDTQVSYALPIAMGIYDEPKFVGNFLNTVSRENTADDGTICPPYSLMTGFIGTAWIQEALSKAGHPEMAYRLLTTTNYPSWLYPVSQGATSIWERLNSYTHKDGFGNNNSMNSFNHYSFGSVGNWLLTRSLGIIAEIDGSVVIAPEPDTTGSLTFAKGWIYTLNGRISSSWRIDKKNIIFEINIPEGTNPVFVFNGKTQNLKPGKTTIKKKIL